MNYADAVRKPPKTLTDMEQRLLLKVSGERRAGFRDHVIFSMALGTGLREHEIVALNMGDVFTDGGKTKRRVQLEVFKQSNNDTGQQEIILPDNVRAKLEKFYQWKKRQGQSLDENAPIFISRKNNRLSTRQLRHLFSVWQERAGVDRRFSFHSLRHYADSRIMLTLSPVRQLVSGFADFGLGIKRWDISGLLRLQVFQRNAFIVA